MSSLTGKPCQARMGKHRALSEHKRTAFLVVIARVTVSIAEKVRNARYSRRRGVISACSGGSVVIDAWSTGIAAIEAAVPATELRGVHAGAYAAIATVVP